MWHKQHAAGFFFFLENEKHLEHGDKRGGFCLPALYFNQANPGVLKFKKAEKEEEVKGGDKKAERESFFLFCFFCVLLVLWIVPETQRIPPGRESRVICVFLVWLFGDRNLDWIFLL